MSIDLRVINTCILTVAAFVGMVIIFALRKRVGVMWLVIAIEVLLLTFLIKRIDVIGLWFGLDIISQDVNDFVVSWIVIIALYASFIKLWQRRREIGQIEALHAAHREENRRMLAAHEEAMRVIDENWIYEQACAKHVEELNKQIEVALMKT